MIVFGYYTVSIKTVYTEELPPEMQGGLGPNDRFQYGLKLAHLMFIPLFPMEKQWMLKQDLGDAYRVTPMAEQYLTQKYGTPGTPFYAFSFWILAAIILLGVAINDVVKNNNKKADRRNTEQQRQESIQTALQQKLRDGNKITSRT